MDQPVSQEQPSGLGPEASGDPLADMITQTDQALTQIAQVLGKASPEAAQALMQINEQYRQVIQSVMSGGPQGGQRPASPMVGPENQGKPSTMAY